HDAPVRKDDPLYRSIGLLERGIGAGEPGPLQAGGCFSHHERFRSLWLLANASSTRPEIPLPWILLRIGFAARYPLAASTRSERHRHQHCPPDSTFDRDRRNGLGLSSSPGRARKGQAALRLRALPDGSRATRFVRGSRPRSLSTPHCLIYSVYRVR